MARSFGIDLGTSRTKISCLDTDIGTMPIAIPIGGSPLVPSIVLFDDEAAPPQIKAGWDVNTDKNDPRVIASVKLHMGKSEEELKDPKTGDIRLPALFGGQSYGPTEISTEILKYVAEGARRLDYDPRTVVVTVPAEFNFRQREATVAAVKGAGLQLQMLLSEPVAALLADMEGDVPKNSRNLVFDLGGGTLDCTVIEIANGNSQVRSKTGGVGIAGDYIDDLIFQHLLKEFQLPTGRDYNERQHRKGSVMLAERCRAVKEGLSDKDSDLFNVANLYLKGKMFDLQREMSRAEFDRLMTPLISVYKSHIDMALREAGLANSQIDRVLLVGGSTRIPVVRRAIGDVFGDRVHSAEKPDLFVSFGAAIAAGALAQGREVIDDTLGQSVGKQSAVSFDFELLLQRGTTFKEANHTEISLWPSGGAKSVALNLYEGADGVKNINETGASGPRCHYIGSYELTPHPAPEANAAFEISYACNPQTTLLEVTARLQAGGGRVDVMRHNKPTISQSIAAKKAARMDVMVLLDTTGSMRYGDWNTLKNELRTSMLKLWDGQNARAGELDMRAALTLFGDSRGQSLAPGDPIQTLPFTARHQEFCRNYLSRIDEFATEGGDDPESCYDALWRAANAGMRADDKTLRVFILITNGSSCAPPTGNLAGNEIVRELQKRDIVVYSVSPYGSDYADLAEQTGGALLEFDDQPLQKHMLAVWQKVALRLNAMVR